MNTKAFIFPGQGSQEVGMAKDLYDQFEMVRHKYATANDILEMDLAGISFSGPEQELTQTRVTQPAIFVHSAVLVDLLKSEGWQAAMAAGHSLGEYSALYAADAFSYEDGLRLVKIRAELMQTAGEKSPGTMAAVIGLESDILVEICTSASADGVVQIANINSPGQMVLSGSVAGVERAMTLASEAGAKRVVKLTVSGAFHSSLMAFATEGLSAALEDAQVKDPAIPVFSNVKAEPMTSSSEIKKNLLDQLTSPVRWTECIQNMISAGATDFYEIGPGSVLRGLLRRIDRSVTGHAVNDTQSLQTLIA